MLPAPVYWQIGLLLQHMPQWDNSGALMRLDRFFADGRCLGMLVFLSDNGPNSHFDTRVRIGSGYSELFVDLQACFGTKLKRSQDSADSSSHPFFTFRLGQTVTNLSRPLCAQPLQPKQILCAQSQPGPTRNSNVSLCTICMRMPSR